MKVVKARTSATIAVALGILAAACSSPTSGTTGTASGASEPPGSQQVTPSSKFTFLAVNESPSIPKILETLAEGPCKAEQDAQPLDVQSVAQTALDQKVQLLAGQGALPVMFSAGNSPDLLQELHKAGEVVEFDQALKDLGVTDDVIPGAVSTLRTLDGGAFIGLPSEMDIEGLWYNKKMFADHGVAVPKTWNDLSQAAETLKAAGITPFAASGIEGWPLTRFLSSYIYRALGPDAMKDVVNGSAKLTDPPYVAAAQQLATFGKDGFFSTGLESIDYDTAIAQFLGGETAMMYMGSWVLENINDPTLNKIGADNIGLMQMPAVDGGKGGATEWPSSVGIPLAMASKTYDKNAAAWLKCISENYGDASLSVANVISGFVAKGGYEKLPNISQGIVNDIMNSSDGFLWFESLFGPKATKTATTNAALLVNGSLTPERYMDLIQTDIDAEK